MRSSVVDHICNGNGLSGYDNKYDFAFGACGAPCMGVSEVDHMCIGCYFHAIFS